MPIVSNFRSGRLQALRAGLAGLLGGGWCGGLLHALAVRAGGTGSPLPFIVILSLAGAALAVALDRLLDWAWRGQERTRSGWWSLVPWGWTIVGVGFLAVPLPFNDAPGSPLGFYKHLLAMLWIGGVLLYAIPLLAALAADPSPRRAAALVGALALLVAPAPVLHPPNESDEGDYVLAALAWAETGTPRVAAAMESGAMDNFYFGHTPSSWMYYRLKLSRHRADVPQFSYRMPAYPLILVPFVQVARYSPQPAVRWFITCLPNLLGLGLLAAGLARIAGAGPPGAWTVISLATATPFLYFTTNTQPEILMAASMAWSLALGQDARTRVRGAALAVLSCLLHERMIIFTGPLVAWMLYEGRGQRVRIMVMAALCVLPVFAAWFATMQFTLPSRVPHAYGDDRLALFAPDRWSRAAWMHLVSISIGLLPHVPILCAVPIAAYRAWRRGRSTPPVLARVGLAIFACYYAVIVTYPHTFDSWPHIRYLIPGLPFLAPILGWATTTLIARRGDRLVLGGLLVFQTLRAWPLLAVPQLWRAISVWF